MSLMDQDFNLLLREIILLKADNRSVPLFHP